MAWPLPGEANFRVAAVHDLRGDGAAELIVLQDRIGTGEPAAPRLAIYRLDQKLFRLVAQASLPEEQIAFPSIGVRDSSNGREIRVRTTPPAAVNVVNPTGPGVCDPEGPGTTGRRTFYGPIAWSQCSSRSADCFGVILMIDAMKCFPVKITKGWAGLAGTVSPDKCYPARP
jgi:hypothetical protein